MSEYPAPGNSLWLLHAGHLAVPTASPSPAAVPVPGAVQGTQGLSWPGTQRGQSWLGPCEHTGERCAGTAWGRRASCSCGTSGQSLLLCVSPAPCRHSQHPADTPNIPETHPASRRHTQHPLHAGIGWATAQPRTANVTWDFGSSTD